MVAQLGAERLPVAFRRLRGGRVADAGTGAHPWRIRRFVRHAFPLGDALDCRENPSQATSRCRDRGLARRWRGTAAPRMDRAAWRAGRGRAPPGQHCPGRQIPSRALRAHPRHIRPARGGDLRKADRATGDRGAAAARPRRSGLSRAPRADRAAQRRRPAAGNPLPRRAGRVLQQRDEPRNFASPALPQDASGAVRRIRAAGIRLGDAHAERSAIGFFARLAEPGAARGRRPARRRQRLLRRRVRRRHRTPRHAGHAARQHVERRMVRRLACARAASADRAAARDRDRAHASHRHEHRNHGGHRPRRPRSRPAAAVRRGPAGNRGAGLQRRDALHALSRLADHLHLAPRFGERGVGRPAAAREWIVVKIRGVLTFQQLILRLNAFWDRQGCVLLQPYDMEVGAGTFHTATFLRAIGPEPWRAAYVQPSRRPKDGRYGDNPNRLQHYYQYQVVLKPSPDDLQDLYLGSLKALGIDLRKNDVRFVEDDWESPTLGAWGLGWEVWLNGMEVTQFTYFQQVGGLDCKPVLGELTYGLERLAMYLQQKESVFDLVWVDGITYGDVYHQNEVEQSKYNFEKSDANWLLSQFNDYESQAKRLIGEGLALPGYEMVLKCSHTFNLLDARGAISVTERAAYIGRVRTLAKLVAQAYYDSREKLGFPMLKQVQTAKTKNKAR